MHSQTNRHPGQLELNPKGSCGLMGRTFLSCFIWGMCELRSLFFLPLSIGGLLPGRVWISGQFQAALCVDTADIQSQRKLPAERLRCFSWEAGSVSSVQLLSHVQLFATPWITACQASLSITNSRSSLSAPKVPRGLASDVSIIFCGCCFSLPWSLRG